MSNKTFDEIKIIGSTDDAGICGPNGCSIADHQKKVATKEDASGKSGSEKK